jgi:hypothetical protein
MPCPSSEKEIVILNGGEAGVRDRTTANGLDDVGGDIFTACSSNGLIRRIAAAELRKVPRRACRPPQDDKAYGRMTRGTDWQ